MHKHGRRLPASVCRKTSIIFENGCLALLALLVLHRAKLLASNQSVLALGVAPSRVRAAAPHSAPSRGEGVFGKDAEIRTHQALHEAKLSECPKGDRDREFAIFLKNKFFLQSEAETRLSENILSSNSFADFTLYLSLSDYDGELLCITH